MTALVSLRLSSAAAINQLTRYLYWEFYEGGVSQAVLLGARWKGIRSADTEAIQLFDLANDIGEQTNVASDNPEVVDRVKETMRTAHVDNEHWKLTSR